MSVIYSEKEIFGDALAASKSSTNLYNTFSNECAHENVRNTMLHILAEEHDIQDDVFHMMSARGLYPTPAAEAKKVDEAKQRFKNCVK